MIGREAMERFFSDNDATSQFLEHLDNSILRVRYSLWRNRPGRAAKELRQASQDAEFLESQVLRLHRSLRALENHFFMDGGGDDPDSVVARAMIDGGLQDLAGGDWDAAAERFENAIDQLSGEGMRVNPFLIHRFWMAIDARWPTGSPTGMLMLSMENLDDRPIQQLRLVTPTPDGWVSRPKMTRVPMLPPGGYVDLGIEIDPLGEASNQLNRRLSITSGYLVDRGDIQLMVRVENRTMQTVSGCLVDPWVPPGFQKPRLPIFGELGPGEVLHAPVGVEPIGMVGYRS